VEKYFETSNLFTNPAKTLYVYSLPDKKKSRQENKLKILIKKSEIVTIKVLISCWL
jgi:hypothetical protein